MRPTTTSKTTKRGKDVLPPTREQNSMSPYKKSSMRKKVLNDNRMVDFDLMKQQQPRRPNTTSNFNFKNVRKSRQRMMTPGTMMTRNNQPSSNNNNNNNNVRPSTTMTGIRGSINSGGSSIIFPTKRRNGTRKSNIYTNSSYQNVTNYINKNIYNVTSGILPNNKINNNNASFRPNTRQRPRSTAEQTRALTKALIQKVGRQHITEMASLDAGPSSNSVLSNGLNEWTEDYLNILENNTNPDANDDNVESSNVINIDNSALLGFKSESILSQIKLTEILRATNGLETPSTLRTAVSIQLLSQYVKQENTNKSKILNVALNELLHSIYCIPDGSLDKVRMSPSTMLTPENINNQDVRDSINKPYFELFKKIKETNESLLQRNAEYRKRLKVIAHASKDRTMAMDTIIYRWKRKIKLFVFLQWKYLTIDDKDKNENISNLFAEMKRRKKYRETFHAWRSMAQQTKNKNFKHIKMSLDAAEKTEDELRDKIDHMGNEIVKQQEQIEELQQVNFQVVMVVADLICQIERENGKGCEA
mgnify:CR=1 FL=1